MVDDYKEDELMALFKAGKAKAFQVVYDRYFARLYFVAFRLLRDKKEAEDIAITILNRAFQRHASFKNMAALNSWLYTGIRNLCTDKWRSRKAEDKRNLEYVRMEGEIYTAVNDELDAELAAVLFAMVERLPERSREVVVLYYMHGLKYREIAEKLQVSTKTVENQLRYALGRLREFFSEDAIAGLMPLLAILFFSKIL